MKDLRTIFTFCCITIISLLASCAHHEDNINDEPIASVGEKILTYGQLKSSVPQNLSVEDSIVFVQDYIKRWIKSELILQKAELNLNPNEKDVAKLLEEYRRSLLIHQYEQKLLEQKFSPLISDTESKECYEEMKDNFKLEGPILKGIMVILPKSAPKLQAFEKLCRSTDQEDLIKLETYCFQNAKKYDIFLDHWVPLKDISDVWPQPISRPDNFVKGQRYYHTSDDTYEYFLSINDYELTSELAPYDYVKKRITTILINKKRLEFIKKLEQDIYNEGMNSNEVKYY